MKPSYSDLSARCRQTGSAHANVELQRLTKSFGAGPLAVNNLSLRVERGELVSLLGPSGCGKTTTLRMISGLQLPDSGRVLLRGMDMTESPPNKRDVGMLFQSYALFPHMTVAANVGYGLRMRGVAGREIRAGLARRSIWFACPNLPPATLGSSAEGSSSALRWPAPW